MKEQQFSLTALITAAIRAYHATHDQSQVFEDFIAPRFLSEGGSKHTGTFLKALQDVQPDFVNAYFDRDGSLPWWLRVIAGAVLSRARYAEDHLEEACRRGASQYVLLGAGLDTFAFRRPDLMQQLQVFEVDHPISQAFAREVFTEANLELPESLHFIAADLEKVRLAEALKGSAFDWNEKTFFGWMGVTYYLNMEKVYALLNDIATCASPGSRVVFDYLDTGFFAPDNPHKSVHAVLDNVSRVGEAMLTGFEPTILAQTLPRLRFHLVEDLFAADIEARYFNDSKTGYHAGNHIHFALAEVAKDHAETGCRNP